MEKKITPPCQRAERLVTSYYIDIKSHISNTPLIYNEVIF